MNFKSILLGTVFVIAVMGSSIGSSVYIAKVLIPEQTADGVEGDGSATEAVPEGPPVYVGLDPFIVNFIQEGSLRYLQLTVQVMSRDEAIAEQSEVSNPGIRNGLILLLSGHSYTELVTREGKESIRDQMHTEINRILGGDGLIEAVYLTGFVMQ